MVTILVPCDDDAVGRELLDDDLADEEVLDQCDAGQPVRVSMTMLIREPAQDKKVTGATVTSLVEGGIAPASDRNLFSTGRHRCCTDNFVGNQPNYGFGSTYWS